MEDLQDKLIDRVFGPKWLPVRDLSAPFGCPGCGVISDFARKGKRTRPRRFDTAVGIARLHAYFARDVFPMRCTRWSVNSPPRASSASRRVANRLPG